MIDMNTTPPIDLMLVLIIMLVITIPIQNHAIKLPDKRVEYESVAAAMAAARRSGVTRIGLVGNEPFPGGCAAPRILGAGRFESMQGTLWNQAHRFV